KPPDGQPKGCRKTTPFTGESLKRPQKSTPPPRIRGRRLLLRLGFADLTRAKGYAAPTRTDEGEHPGYFRGQRAGALETFDRELQILARSEQRDKGVAQGRDRGSFDSGAAQSDRIDCTQRLCPISDAERRNVTAHSTSATGQSEPSDAGELMDHAITRDQRAIANLDPSREQRAPADDDLIADPAVVSNMRVVHDEVVVADDGYFAPLASTMNRGTFAKHVAIADPHLAQRTRVGKVLRLIADHRGRMNHIVRADLGIAENRHVADEPRPRADFDSALEQAERPNLDTRR